MIRPTEAEAEIEEDWLEQLAHDLLAPISTLLLWEDVLRNGGDDPDRRNQALAAIGQSARAQARLVEDFRDLVRARRGKLELTPSSFELDALVRAAAGERVSTALDAGAWVVGDRERLARALDRVIAYAVTLGATRVELARGAEEHVLAIGIPRSPAADMAPGLGIAIARSVVELHGGSLVVGDAIVIRIPALTRP